MEQRDDIRLSLPSKGRLSEAATEFLAACGLSIRKPNPRQYEASIPSLPGLTVLYQRPGDIVVSVREGSVDFGITGMDIVCERRGTSNEVLVLHDELGFGHCRLNVAVPEAWEDVFTMDDLADHADREFDRPLRVATKFPNLTGAFLEEHHLSHTLIEAEGTLEVAPAIGYADIISDLVSSGQTLRDNRLRPLEDGVIVRSEAALIANRSALKQRPEVLSIARELLEILEAHLRAESRLSLFANIRGESPDAIAEKMFAQGMLEGLQGPTISRVIIRKDAQRKDMDWYAIHIVVDRDDIFQAVAKIREIGGSGVVVTPLTYIFEEEPQRYREMMDALEEG